jgi:hypothetical protein
MLSIDSVRLILEKIQRVMILPDEEVDEVVRGLEQIFD